MVERRKKKEGTRVVGNGGGGWRERDCAKIGRLPPSKLVGLEELCELFLPVCPPRIYERRVDALGAASHRTATGPSNLAVANQPWDRPVRD